MRASVSKAIGAIACVMVSVLGGCSAVLGIESDRHVVSDQGDAAVVIDPLGPADAGHDAAIQPGPWGCLEAPPQTLNTDQQVAVTLLVTDPLKPFASTRNDG